MISAFSILFASALLSLLLHRTLWLKPFILMALLIGMCLSGTEIGLNGFETSQATNLFEFILQWVLFAVVLHDKNEITMTQILFIGAASIALLQSSTLISFVISFEALSIISMVLVSHIRTSDQAEGAIKMFIAGATSTGILLLGTAFYLMGGGVLDKAIDIHANGFASMGIILMLFGVFYKLTIVPMHGWAIDTYTLIRHSHAGLLTGVAKTVVAVATFKIFSGFLATQIDTGILLLALLSVLTMTLGNFLALFQTQISRILAYSSIAHAGYILLAFVGVKSSYASTGLLYMAIAYIFMQTAVFLLLDTLANKYSIKSLDDLKGLGKANRILAFFFTVQLFSLAGIPLLAGFLAKAVVFYAVVDAGLWYIVLIALLNSALSVGYYAWIIKHIYFDAPTNTVLQEQTDKHKHTNEKHIILSQTMLLLGTVFFGIFASLVFSVI